MTNDNVPTSIRVVYYDDLDILKIDELVKSYLNAYARHDMEQYISDTRQLLNSYLPLASDKIISSGSMRPVVRTKSQIRMRIDIIERYIDIAKTYARIDAYNKNERRYMCSCGRPWNDEYVNSEGIKYQCPCGHVFYSMTRELQYTDVAKSQSPTADESNFSKAIDRFCCHNRSKRIDPSLFTTLDRYFTERGMVTGEKQRSKSIDPLVKKVGSAPDGRILNKRGTSVSMLQEALKETGNTLYNSDVVLIGHLYWDWVLPNIYMEIDHLINLYDKTQLAYNDMRRDNPLLPSKASINSNTRLYLSMVYLGIPCNKDDFPREYTQEQLNLWSEMIRHLESKTL